MRIDSSQGPAPGRPTIYAAIATLLAIWALNFIAGKIALRYWTPLALASFRVVLAAIFLVLLYPLCRLLPVFVEASRPRHQGSRRFKDFWPFIYLGFFGISVNQICFTVGLRYTSVTHSSVIVGMGPIYALILAVLFRLEFATVRKVTGMLIALAGVVLMTYGPHDRQGAATLLGDVITLTGSVGFAMYGVLGKRVAARYDTLTMTTYNAVFGALLVLPIAIHSARAIGPLANWCAIPVSAWIGLLYMALFSSVLAYLFYFWLLRYLEVTELMSFSYLLPVTATILSIIFLGERGTVAELIGGALALSGVYWVESGRNLSLKV
jgi:drug/metabolite transporter (DMT)-like permease